MTDRKIKGVDTLCQEAQDINGKVIVCFVNIYAVTIVNNKKICVSCCIYESV